MAIAPAPGRYIERPRPSGPADVIDVVLDKGLVIDAYVRVSLVTSGGAKSKTKGVLEGVKETLSGSRTKT